MVDNDGVANGNVDEAFRWEMLWYARTVVWQVIWWGIRNSVAGGDGDYMPRPGERARSCYATRPSGRSFSIASWDRHLATLAQ